MYNKQGNLLNISRAQSACDVIMNIIWVMEECFQSKLFNLLIAV